MIHVLMINYEYPPLGGGGSNATKYILEQFTKEPNIKVDLITTSSNNLYYTDSINPNIMIYFLPIKKKYLHYWKEKEILEFLLKALFFSKKLIRKKHYNLIHSIFGFPCGLIPYLYRKFPYIISLRGSDVPGFNVRFAVQYIFLTPLFRKIWKKSTIITVNSVGLQKLAKKTSKDKKFMIIPNGVDIEEFGQKKDYRMDKNSVFKILTVSRLIKRKRIEDLIYSVEILRSDNLNVELTIIGKGKNEKHLKKLTKNLQICNWVFFEGYIPHQKLPHYYKNADVFVLPSLNEGMSNTALEALASGLPLILTNVGGTSELINNNGFIINTKAPNQIVDAIKKLYNDPFLNQKMGNNSRLHANLFSWKSVARSYLRLYYKVGKK